MSWFLISWWKGRQERRRRRRVAQLRADAAAAEAEYELYQAQALRTASFEGSANAHPGTLAAQAKGRAVKARMMANHFAEHE